MPCKKCKDGKYKWGNTGECKYATKDECEKANPKKYSKMKNTPTPLGKKTYAEYEKELKEYNLSQVQRFEFNSVKQIGSMASKLDALVNKLEKGYLDVDDKVFKYRKLEEEKIASEENLDEVAKEYKDAEDKAKQWKDELKILEGDFTKLQKKYDSAYDKAFKAEEAIGKSNQKYLDNYDKADSLADKLTNSIQDVKKQLKGLGISQVPDEVEVGEIAVESFSGMIKNAMNDLMR